MNVNLPLIAGMAEEIRAILGDDDPDLIECIDAECNVLDLMDQLIRDRSDAAAYEAACKAEAEAYTGRAKRFGDRQRRIAVLMGKLLDAIGERKVERPLATISRTKGRAHVEITDPDSVPSQLCLIVRTPDKAAIRKQLEAGETVPGAELQVGAPGVAVRR